MPQRFPCALILVALVLVYAFFLPARAATVTWQADLSAPADWFDPANWSAGALPTFADTTQINNAGQARIAVGAASVSTLQLGANAGGVGTLSLTGGQITASSAYVGYSGSGSISQSGGIVATNTLYLAGTGNGSFGPTGSGTYTLSGGNLNTGTTYVGYTGNATFTQSGGIHNTSALGGAGPLYVGYNSRSSGTYNLLGNASLTGNTIYLGYFTDAVGVFNLSGNASVSAHDEHVGFGGPGTFAHTSGTNTVGDLYVGGSSAPGSYTLGDGAVLSAKYLTVTNGSFKQTGGTFTFGSPGSYVTDAVYLASASKSSASYSLSGVAAVLSGSGAVHMASGSSSTATFTQSGGAVSTGSQPLYLAEGTGGSFASYSLSAGSLATGAQIIGHTGTGSFDQSGGINRAGNLYLGYNASAVGSYSLAYNAQLLSGAQYHANNTSARSTFTQSGGTNNLGTNALYLAYGANSSASYIFAGGTLFSGNQYVGYNGVATFTQSGGVNDLGTGTLYLGSNSANARGFYHLTGPDAVLVAGAEDIGPGGASLFRQAAGTNAAGTLTVRGGSRYELSGGSLQLASPLSNSGVFDLLTGSLTTPAVVNDGTLNFAGGAVRAAASPALASVTGTGSTSVAAGVSLTAGYLRQAALSVAGSVTLLGATPSSTLSSLSLAPGSRLDLMAGTLLINSGGGTPAAVVRQYLHDGLLVSSTADSDPLHRLALAYLVSPAGGSITIKTAPVGDANLDGAVGDDDYALIDKGFNQGLTLWAYGDFNYDGVVDQADYFLIDRAVAIESGVLSPALLAMRESQFGDAYVSQLLLMIPEPSLVAGMLAIPLATRRCRR